MGIGVAGHAKQTITVTAGPSGLPHGFEIWWMDAATYSMYNGQWPASPTPEMGYARFTGSPTLNTFDGQYTTFLLAPYESVKIEIGDLRCETGVSGTTEAELDYGTIYYFVSFAIDGSGVPNSEASLTVDASTTYTTNCTYTQGYWKTHPDAWPVTSLTLGTVVYTQSELLSILNQSVGGNGLLSLAHQLIAAKLNIAFGADPSAAIADINAADALIGGLVVPPVGSGYLDPSTTSSVTQVLDDYNNGVIGPGHCGIVATEESTWGHVKAIYGE
jgi:hypothetical protein